MNKLRNLSIKTKFIIMGFVITLLAVIFLGIFSVNHEKHIHETELNERAGSLVDNLAVNSVFDVIVSNKKELKRLAQGIIRQKDVVYAHVENKDGEVLVEARDADLTEDVKTKSYTAPIINEKQVGFADEGMILRLQGKVKKEAIGKAVIKVSLSSLEQKINELKKTFLVIALTVFVLIVVSIILIVNIYIGIPIKKLVSATQKISKGDLDYKIQVESYDEIGVLADFFNKMTENIKRLVAKEKELTEAEKTKSEKLQQANEEISEKTEELESMNEELKTTNKKLLSVNNELASVTYDLSRAKSGLEEKVKERTKELSDRTFELEDSNKELRETTGQLIQSEKMSALGELTAGVAHELNQPLNSIKIICQSMLRDLHKGVPEKELGIDTELSDVVKEVDKMAGIIDHMRIFTRRTEGAVQDVVSINETIEGALKFIEQQLIDHNISLIKKLDKTLPPVKGDAIRLEQIFMNLITNARFALEAVERENKRLEINSFTSEDKKNIVVEVKDNGTGIPEEIQKKVFQAFFTTKEPGKGTGLGLSLVWRIAEEHRGRVELESKAGEGTLFRVILPAGQ